MSIQAPDEISIEDPLCNSSSGSMVTLDYVTPLTVGRRFPIGNAYSYNVKKGYSYLCLWMTSNWLERRKTLIRCGNYSTKKLIWGEPSSFLDHVFLGCTQRQCEISKDFVDNYRTRNVWNDIVSWQTRRLQQLYIVSTPCIDDHHFREEELKSVRRTVTSMLSRCSEMLILGTNWTT